MKNIPIRDFETDNLIIKKPTMEEQYALWNILKDEMVNRYYFPTPDRIFIKYKSSLMIGKDKNLSMKRKSKILKKKIVKNLPELFF